jgi:hypothetical protein
MPVLHYNDGRRKSVKNLGWLLRNWSRVASFGVTRPYGLKFERTLFATMKHGDVVTTYEADFMDDRVLANFLRRPVFVGLPCYWGGVDGFIGPSRNKHKLNRNHPF